MHNCQNGTYFSLFFSHYHYYSLLLSKIKILIIALENCKKSPVKRVLENEDAKSII